MRDKYLECISLGKEYKSGNKIVTALNDINLTIHENEFALIRGRSGSGKTTLLNLMSGLINPSHGKVIIGNTCITEMTNDALSNLLMNKVGFIFQSFNLLPSYSIYENIELALIPKGEGRRVVKETIMAHLEKFNLLEKSNMMPSELSVGQQQMVAIIRTLVKQPSVIFADEPTGSVDDETASEIMEHLLFLKKDKDVTIVMTSHGSIAEKMADVIFTLENGRIKN